MFAAQLAIGLLAIAALIATLSSVTYGVMWTVLLVLRWLPLVGRRHQRYQRMARRPVRSNDESRNPSMNRRHL